jgi:hypothetical protein
MSFSLKTQKRHFFHKFFWQYRNFIFGIMKDLYNTIHTVVTRQNNEILRIVVLKMTSAIDMQPLICSTLKNTQNGARWREQLSRTAFTSVPVFIFPRSRMITWVCSYRIKFSFCDSRLRNFVRITVSSDLKKYTVHAT